MSASIVPSVTAADAHAYREQMARIAPFAKRIHIDLSDGEFSPVKLINPIHVYWPEGAVADLHLMYTRPLEQLETVISLQPELVIIQAEAQGDTMGILRQLRAVGIKTGVALLQATEPEDHSDMVAEADHVLIFSGDLGHYGGQADLTLLRKVAHIRAINPTAELGWDGGVSAENAAQLAAGGIEVAVVGGGIQNAPDAAEAFKALNQVLPKEAAL